MKDQCKDILREKIFKHSEYRKNNYFQQIIYSRFLSATYEQSKNDKELGFGVPLGEIVLDGNYTEDQFKQKKKEIEASNFKSVMATQEIDVALTSGDEAVISAWSTCMSSKGGVSLRFEPASDTEIFATLEWFADAGVAQTRLSENINLPVGAEVTNGARYFKKGALLTASNPRRATIILPDAFMTIAVTVTTENGSDEAYLPPRVKLQKEVRPYTELDKLRTAVKGSYKTPTTTVSLSAKQLAEGWTFDPDSARVTLEKIEIAGGNYCKSEYAKADLYTFTYGFEIEGLKNVDDTAVCQIHPSIMMKRERWVPIGNGVSE